MIGIEDPEFLKVLIEKVYEKSGKYLYENEVLRFMEEAKEKGWKYNRITVGVYDNIPSEKVNGTEQFKMKWEDTCKQLEYADFFLLVKILLKK